MNGMMSAIVGRLAVSGCLSLNPGADIKRATEHFEAGVAKFKDEAFPAARHEFEQAYAMTGDARVLYNIAATYIHTEDYAAAIRTLRRYRVEAGSEIDDERRADVRRLLESLSARVGTVIVHCDVEGARVIIDGKTVGRTPLDEAWVVNPGSVEVRLEAPGHRAFEAQLVISRGNRHMVDAMLRPLPGSTPPPTASLKPLGEVTPRAESDRDVSTRPDRRAKGLAIATYSSLGVTLAAGAGTLACGLLTLRADDQLQQRASDVPANLQAIDDAELSRQRLATATDALVGVTAASAAVTLGLGIAAIVAKRKMKLRAGPGLSMRF